MGLNFPYSGLSVAMPLPGDRYGAVWYSWIIVLRRKEIYCINHFWQSFPGSLPRRSKREVQEVQDTIMLFLLWKHNDGKLSNVCHVNISSWGCLKEKDTSKDIFLLFLKENWTLKFGILKKSQNLPINGNFKFGGGSPEIGKIFYQKRDTFIFNNSFNTEKSRYILPAKGLLPNKVWMLFCLKRFPYDCFSQYITHVHIQLNTLIF